MKRFLGVFKRVGMIAGKAAPDIVSVWSPPLGALLGTVLQGIVHAEATMGPGNGEGKKDMAMEGLMVAGPLIEMLASQALGRRVDIDERLLAEGASDLIDGLVKILNATQALPKAPAKN